MAFSTTLLRYLIVTISTVTSLCVEGRLIPSNTQAPDTEDDAITVTIVETSVSTSMDNATEATCATSTHLTPITVPEIGGFYVIPRQKLVCPTTRWYLVEIDNVTFGLYRRNKQGEVSEYKVVPNAPSVGNVIQITNLSTQIIHDEACNHTAIYQCKKFTNIAKLHNCTVSNCTFKNKLLMPYNTEAGVPLNALTRVIFWSFTLATGPILGLTLLLYLFLVLYFCVPRQK